MPGGQGIPSPFKAAKPVEAGWSPAAWYRAYNLTDSRIRKAEGPAAEVTARESGRTREEAKLLKDSYCQISGKKRKSSTNELEQSLSSAPVLSAPENTVEASSFQHRLAEVLEARLSKMAVTLVFTYPLTPAQAEQVLTIYEEDTMKLNEDLESVRAICTEKCSSDTKKCAEHSKEIRRLWRSYYTNVRSGSWASYRSSDYVVEMKKLFDGKVDIHAIHARAAKEKRMHFKDALCTVRFNDDPMVKKYKLEAAAMYDGNTPEMQIREFIRKRELEVVEQRSPTQLAYDSRLALCKSEEEKRAIYQEDACTRSEGDTQAMIKLRLKWQGLFEDGMPYADIYTIIQKDVTDFVRLERELREKLDELQRAKAGHDKEEIVREAKKAGKETAARIRMLSKYTFYCTTEGCQNLSVPISQDEGNLECGICNRLARDGMPRKRSYFCSEECMERDGRTHILTAHTCTAAAACTTGIFNRSVHEKYFGYCPDCWKNFDTESYFCSNECWTKNYNDHCKQVHTQLRAELAHKLENNREFFEAWAKKIHLTDEEIRKAMAGVNWAHEPSSLAIRPSHSPY